MKITACVLIGVKPTNNQRRRESFAMLKYGKGKVGLRSGNPTGMCMPFFQKQSLSFRTAPTSVCGGCVFF